MLHSAPFAGVHPILQPFGANADAPTARACGGAPLRGHDGIDFALPAGTPVLAVQEGVVQWAGIDARHGRAVLLEHAWGQSLYGHLAEVAVAAGTTVAAGEPLGRSGIDATTGTAQLHFGLRIAPYSLADGWCGCSDPQPYLDRLERRRGAILGPHIVGGIQRHLPLLERWQPRLLVVVDPRPDEMRSLRRSCPETVLVGRVFVPSDVVRARIQDSPAGAARWAHELVEARLSPHVDYWQVADELLQEPDELPLLAEFELRRMALAENAGYRCALFGFGTGRPDLPADDPLAAWRLLDAALARAERQGHCIALHQYAAPDMTHPSLDGHIHRLEHQLLRRLPYKRLTFAVTEFGIDGLLLGDEPKGWRQFLAPQEYANQLLRAGRYLERFSGRVLGYAIYGLGVAGPWADYEIEGEVAETMAKRAKRGTWAQVSTESGGLDAAETDRAASPSGEDSPGAPPYAETQAQSLARAQPEQAARTPFESRISPWAQAWNLRIRPVAERPDNPPAAGEVLYRVKDLFTTVNGSWEPGNQPGSIPQWARDAYLRSDFREAGADHHLFAAVLGVDGTPLRDHEVTYWSDGFERLGDPSYPGFIDEHTKQDSGWAHIVLFSGSSFVPERGEAGPWCWMPAGRSEVVSGGGLPANHHVSTFAVWQAVPVEPAETEPAEPEPAEPAEPVTPAEPVEPAQPVQPASSVERRLGSWVDFLNLGIKAVHERPDAPQGDIVYVVKHLFTTRDGSWEPSDVMGAVEPWARDAYLKPWGAPDYFDDAGADHHLFGAVLDLDGRFVREAGIVYWSDGFGQLANPAYAGYVRRTTKPHSGWANLPMDGGANYFPENGQQGPWCWAPAGASEVVVGGGMPANHHVSVFAVWQAVRRSVAPPPGDHEIFLPWAAKPEAGLATGAATGAGQGADRIYRLLREEAWLRVGIETAHDTPIAQYARGVGLGMPVTHEFETAGVRAQAFAGGIAYAPLDQPDFFTHIAW